MSYPADGTRGTPGARPATIDPDHDRRNEHMAILGLLGLLTLLTLLTLLSSLWQHHTLREDLRKNAEQTQQNRERLVDQMQQRQIYVAECSRLIPGGPNFGQTLQACVDNRVNNVPAPGTSPSPTTRPSPTPTVTPTPTATPSSTRPPSGTAPASPTANR